MNYSVLQKIAKCCEKKISLHEMLCLSFFFSEPEQLVWVAPSSFSPHFIFLFFEMHSIIWISWEGLHNMWGLHYCLGKWEYSFIFLNNGRVQQES